MVNVYRAGKPLKKAAWLTVILFAGFLAFYQSSVLLSDYLGDSTWMTSVSYEMPAEGSLEWPNITVCNLNRNFKSRFEADNLNDSREKAYVATMLKDAIEFHEIYQKRQFSPETADLSQTISTTLSRFNQRLQNMINVTSRQVCTKDFSRGGMQRELLLSDATSLLEALQRDANSLREVGNFPVARTPVQLLRQYQQLCLAELFYFAAKRDVRQKLPR